MNGDELIEGVKRRITMPANQYLLQDADILAFADDAISNHIVPALMSVNWEFFVQVDTVTSVANQAEYDINYRAVGRSLRDIKIGPTLSYPRNLRDLVYINPEDSHLFAQSTDPIGFFFRGDQIVLVPTPTTSSYTIEISYHLMPGKMIQPAGASKVVSVAANVVTVDMVPAAITAGSLVDFIRGRAGNRTVTVDYSVSSSGGILITFADSSETQYLVVGDYISPAQYSPLVQLPPQAHAWLKTLAGIFCLRACDDSEGAAALQSEADKEKSQLLMMISPRVVGESKKIINKSGILRGGRAASGFFGVI